MASNQQSSLFIKKKKTSLAPLRTAHNNKRTQLEPLDEEDQVVTSRAAPAATNSSSKSDTSQTTPALSPASASTTSSSHLRPNTPAYCDVPVVDVPATKKKRPVPISDSKRPSLNTFYAIAAPPTPSQLAAAAYRTQAEGVCMRWGWPDPSRLDREAKVRVKQEVTFLEQANSLMDSQSSIESQLEQAELQRLKAQADKGKPNEVSHSHMRTLPLFLCRRQRLTTDQIEFINKQSELEQELDSIVASMTALDRKYKESYTNEKVWDCPEQVDLWERLAATMEKQESKAGKLGGVQQKQMPQHRSQANSASTTMPKGSVSNIEKALQQAKRSRPTRASIVRSTKTTAKQMLAAAPPKDRSPSISPARDPYSRKRKNPTADYGNFTEDSDDENNDAEFEKFSKELEERRQRLSDSDEPKPAPRKMPKPKQRQPASPVSDEEKKHAEQQAAAVQQKERAKKRKLRMEIFPSGEEEAMNDEAAPSKGAPDSPTDSKQSTPLDSGYGSTRTV